MKNIMVRMNYNHLLNITNEVIDSCRSKKAELYRGGIAIGFSILSQYMVKIAERAIELNDDVLLELLLNLNVIKEEPPKGE